MFAVTYSTQAILPELGRSSVSLPRRPADDLGRRARARLRRVDLGPSLDRYSRKRSIVLACALLVRPLSERRSRRTSASCLRSVRCRSVYARLLTAGSPMWRSLCADDRRSGDGYYVASLVAEA